MRLISLVEPWATLMMLLYKRVETRDWSTAYRGPLAIHASKHGMSLQDTLATCLQPTFYNALMNYEPFRDRFIHYRIAPRPEDVDKRVMKDCFPNRSKIVCVVDLKDIVLAGSVHATRHREMFTSTELAFGNYDAVDKESGNGRQAWVTEYMFRLPEPIAFTSKQGLVAVPQDVHAEMRKQWNLTNK